VSKERYNHRTGEDEWVASWRCTCENSKVIQRNNEVDRLMIIQLFSVLSFPKFHSCLQCGWCWRALPPAVAYNWRQLIAFLLFLWLCPFFLLPTPHKELAERGKDDLTSLAAALKPLPRPSVLDNISEQHDDLTSSWCVKLSPCGYAVVVM